MDEKAFILTAECSDIRGRCGLKFYCISDTGPVLIVIENHKPLFFIKSSTPPVFTENTERKKLELTDFSGNPVDALYYQSLDKYFNHKRYLKENSITLYESDIRAEDRYLMERYINSSVNIKGKGTKQNGITVYYNPVLKSGGDYRPDFKILSLDIETGTDGSIYSAAFHCRKGSYEDKSVLMRNPDNKSGSFSSAEDTAELIISPSDVSLKSVTSQKDKLSVSKNSSIVEKTAGSKIDSSFMKYFPDEKNLITGIIKYLQSYDPDIIIGWHVIGFDLKFIERRASYYHIPLKLGRGYRPIRIDERRSGLFSAAVEGRIVIDGPQALRTAFYKFDSFSLENVAQELLGRGKDITPDKDKVAEIERRFREDRESLAFYNLEDAVLVSEIFEKTAILDQLLTRSLITGLALDKVHMSVASFDHFMLPAVHRKGYAAPDTDDIVPGKPAMGGYVFTSDPGLYRHVAVMDFKSLYPSIIRTFFIDPLSRLKADENPVKTPAGITFSSTNHILPEFLEKLMKKREEAKKNKDMYLSQAVKILMNSFYGVMGTPGCRFYNPDLPSAITGTGQWILKTVSAYLRESGYSVIYGDTDSVFVCLKEHEYSDLNRAGTMLTERVNNYFSKLLKDVYSVESELEIEFETHYIKYFLPPVRYTEGGARKRYAGLLENGEIEYKGLETVRSDWTDLAKEFQKELFVRFFAEDELVQWIKKYVEDLKSGIYDSRLIYRKKLSRPASEYIKNRPPHVKAALMLDPEGVKKIKEISYIMTAEGPVPVEMYSGDADYSHYIEKQIRPVADGVLFSIGEDFDSITGGKQLSLF